MKRYSLQQQEKWKRKKLYSLASFELEKQGKKREAIFAKRTEASKKIAG